VRRFLLRVLKAAGGLEHLSAQWEGRARRRPLLSLPRAATAICRRGTMAMATVAGRHAKTRRRAGAGIEGLARSKWSGIGGARRTLAARHGSKSREEQEDRHDREVLARLDDGS
jgi:hypothetical protein